MPLREYQEQLVSRVREAWIHGKKAPCIVLPCGGGKSCIVAEMAKRTTDNKKRVLFLVHRKELCAQIGNTFRRWGVDMLRCSVMMVQTASRRISKIPPPALIITDENHHSTAASYRKVYEAFPDAKRVGVTATPVRIDGSGLGDVNDILVEGVSAKWLINNNFLAPYDYYAPSLVDMTGVKIKKGDYDTVSVENLMLRKAIFGDVIKYYNKLAKGRQAVCYCVSIRHSMETAVQFNMAGIEAAHIDGSTPKPERQRIIEDFRRGAIDILCNVDLISEGFDVPDVPSNITYADWENAFVKKEISVDKSVESGIIKIGSDGMALENQRYGRNKDTIVNKTYIESGEYRRKFDKITDNPKVNKIIYSKAKEMLKHRSGTMFEDMYWINAKTGDIIASALDEKTKSAVKYSESIKKSIHGKTNIIAMHTHPHSMPPSAADFNSAKLHGYNIGIIICHNGSIFKYRSNEEISVKLCEMYIQEFIDFGSTEFEAQVSALKKLKESYNIDFEEVK